MSTKRKLKKMMSVLFISGCFFLGNTKCKGADLEYISQETANYAVQERGYDLDVYKRQTYPLLFVLVFSRLVCSFMSI